MDSLVRTFLSGHEETRREPSAVDRARQTWCSAQTRPTSDSGSIGNPRGAGHTSPTESRRRAGREAHPDGSTVAPGAPLPRRDHAEIGSLR